MSELSETQEKSLLRLYLSGRDDLPETAVGKPNTLTSLRRRCLVGKAAGGRVKLTNAGRVAAGYAFRWKEELRARRSWKRQFDHLWEKFEKERNQRQRLEAVLDAFQVLRTAIAAAEIGPVRSGRG